MGRSYPGIALVPGVSRNKRLYTSEAIGKAVARARQRLAEGGRPLTMLTHHDAGDDSTRIVAQVTEIDQADDGSAPFRLAFADTDHARTVENLVDPDGLPPFLEGVSIRGWWLGDVRTVMHDGQAVETADDLEIDGIDFTKLPGVPAARVAVGEGDARRTPITESVTLEADKAPYGDVDYADPGYQSDGKKRYPLDTKAHAKAAWSYINQADNAKAYTSAQLKRIKGRVKAALKKFGVAVDSETAWLVDRGRVAEATLAEAYGWGYDQAGTLCVSLSNGPMVVSVSSYCLDPHDLDRVGMAAMKAAIDAMTALDPDGDGDIDLPGATEDDDMETTGQPEGAPAVEAAATATENREGTDVAEATTTTEAKPADKPADPKAATTETTAPAPLTAADIPALAEAFAAAITKAQAAHPDPDKTTEGDDKGDDKAAAEALTADRVGELLKEATDKIRADVLAQYGPPKRKGLVGESSATPDKPLHEMTDEQWAEHRTRVLNEYVSFAR